MDIKELGEKIQRLHDIEEIKTLKYEYALGCDLLVNEGDERLLEVFTDDITWDGGSFGKFEGIESMKAFAKEAPNVLKFTYHFFTNPIIKIDGDKAEAQWYLYGLYTMPDGTDMVLVGSEFDKYRKVDGRWLMSEMKLVPNFFVPYKEGWGPSFAG